MKKSIIICVLVALFCAMTTSGCQNVSESQKSREPSFVTLLVDSGNGSSLAISDAEQIAEWYTWTTEPGTVPEEKSILFEGVQYDGRYSKSYGKEGRSGLYDEYKIVNPKDYLYFVIERESGELVSISFHTDQVRLEIEKDLPIPENPKQNAIQEAEKWAEKLLDDPKEYQRKDVAALDGIFVFRFVRIVDDKETLDYLGLIISDRGRLVYFEKYTSGWGKEAEQQLEILKTAPVEELIQAELSKQNASLAEIYSSYYGRTPDGKVVLIVNCSVGIGNGLTTGAKFLIGVE